MSVADIMMALFCEENKRKVEKITNHKIYFTDGTVKSIEKGIEEYRELFPLLDEDQLY